MGFGLRACIVVGLSIVPHATTAGPTPVELGWPATTTAVIARHRFHPLDAIGGKPVGVVAANARFTWKQIVAGTKHGCKAWIELEPKGWACASDLSPTDKATSEVADPNEKWADVRPEEGTDAFDTIDAIKSLAPTKHVGDHTYVVIHATTKVIAVDNVRYAHTDQGWIATKDLAWYEPSPYVGVDLAAGTAIDFGWAVARKPGAKIMVRDTAAMTGVVTRQLSPRDRATILGVEGAFAKIGTNEYVDLVELRRPPAVVRPTGVEAKEKWIDVDLDQQTLVAYEGDVAVFTTVVSTGRWDWPTPTGIYRIKDKAARTRMQDPGNLAESWNVADVPWSMGFRKNYALHGTYWHDGFGRQRSHGCVNLSTGDAKHLWDWVQPVAPAGWTEVENDGTGTVVRIHSTKDPDPKWLDYDGKPLKTVTATRSP